MAAERRFSFIEGFRAIAAFYVVLQHCCTMADPYGKMHLASAQPHWLAVVMAPLWYGHFAVASFIVISGFCLQMSLHQRGDGRLTDKKRFFARRMERILPPYYACLILSLVVCFTVTQYQHGMPWEQYLPVTPTNTAAHFLMIHNLSRDWMYKINGVLWSIAIEFQLYLFFPLLTAALWKYKPRIVLPSLLTCFGVILWFSDDAKKLYIWYGFLFVLGMSAAKWAFEETPWLPKPKVLDWIGIGLAVIAIMLVRFTKEIEIRDLVMGAAASALLISGVRGSKFVGAFGVRPLAGLGSFSYSLYLIHHPIIQVLYANKPASVNTITREMGYLFLIGIPVILAVTYGFYWIFERPFAEGILTRRAKKPIPSSPQ